MADRRSWVDDRLAGQRQAMQEAAFRANYPSQIASQGTSTSPIGDILTGLLERAGMGGQRAYDVGQGIESAAELTPYGGIKQAAAGDPAALENLVGGPAGGAAKAMFLGLGSRMADKGALATAKSMMAEGASREDILKKTGWFQQHGDWKYEISDQPGQLSDSALDQLLGNAGEAKGQLGPSAQSELFGGPPQPGVFNHPELFESHPQLADIPTETSLSRITAGGGYSPATGIGAMGRGTGEVRDIGLHEIQHAVQNAENFPRGGNPSDQSLTQEMRSIRPMAEGLYERLNQEHIDWVRQRAGLGDNGPEGIEQARAYNNARKEWRELNPEKGRLLDQYFGIGYGGEGPRAGYHHLAGEVEARNTAKRRDMSMEERRASPPWATQDIPDELQIVRRQVGPGSFEASAPTRDELAGVMGPGTQGMKAAEPLAHGRISQRLPSSPKATEDPLTENLLINMDVMRQDPAKVKQASDILATYPNTTPEMMEMNPGERINAARDQMTENIVALYDMMPPEARERSSKWYLGANKITGDRASEIGIPHAASAGAYAAQSPQKDWFQNVYLGDQVLRGLDVNPRLNGDMMNLAATLPAYKPDAMEMLRSVEGRRLLDMDPTEQALVMRLWDETQGPRQYRKITPEGDYGDLVTTKGGQPAKPAWGTFGDIEKALRSAQSGGDLSTISPLMGGKHKVRNFYNNIIAPIEGRPFGDITADTHQIAASLFRPLSGSSPEVLQGLQSGSGGVMTPPVSAMTGMRGLYPIYADATRQAAALRGEPVHAMQSIPWEGIRSLYPAEFKTASNQSKIDDIWRAVGRGEITAEEARRRSVDAAGGFRAPTW